MDGVISTGNYYFSDKCKDCFLIETTEGGNGPSVKVKIDLNKIYKKVLNKEEIHCRHDILQYIYRYFTILESGKRHNKSVDIHDKIQLPCIYDESKDKTLFSFFKELTPQAKSVIYNYQLEDIDWMMKLENGATEMLVPKRHIKIFKDMFLDKKYCTLDINPRIKYKKIKNNSGCLMGDGLGKTLSVVSLISVSEKKKSLVITNNTGCSHWAGEFEKFSNLKYIVISSKKQFQKIQLKDIIESDVIISSYEFLRNKNYKNRIRNYETKFFGDYLYNIKRMSKEVELKDSDTEIPFNLINWDRLVLDECQYISDPLNSYMDSIQYGFKWLVSGFPFTGRSSCKNHIEFLGDIDCISHNNWRKNTIESVSRELVLPGITEDVEYLTLTDSEKNIYGAVAALHLNSSNFDDELRKLCCLPNMVKELRSLDTIDEIKKELIKMNNDRMKGLSRDSMGAIMKRNEFLSREITNEFRCPFCLEDKETPVIAICGHVYCEDCYIIMCEFDNLCGICRQGMTFYDAIKLRKIGDSIGKYGTKFSSIIKYVNTIKDEKIILFTEWGHLVPMISEVIEKECGVKTIDGRRGSKGQALFETCKTGCILLLSTNSVSNGLACSSNIIFLEPSLDYKYSNRIIHWVHRLGQTKSVKVKRYVFKDSVENRIHSNVMKRNK